MHHTAVNSEHTATHCSSPQRTATHCITPQHTTTHCNTLQYTTIHYNTMQHTATHCIILLYRRVGDYPQSYTRVVRDIRSMTHLWLVTNMCFVTKNTVRDSYAITDSCYLYLCKQMVSVAHVNTSYRACVCVLQCVAVCCRVLQCVRCIHMCNTIFTCVTRTIRMNMMRSHI